MDGHQKSSVYKWFALIGLCATSSLRHNTWKDDAQRKVVFQAAIFRCGGSFEACTLVFLFCVIYSLWFTATFRGMINPAFAKCLTLGTKDKMRVKVHSQIWYQQKHTRKYTSEVADRQTSSMSHGSYMDTFCVEVCRNFFLTVKNGPPGLGTDERSDPFFFWACSSLSKCGTFQPVIRCSETLSKSTPDIKEDHGKL